MKISVIIPTYNEENVISGCLSSLAKQTQEDLEIIVVDDGSTDSTRKLIIQAKEEIKEIELFEQKHRGPGEARNFGASKSKGTILVFVDADMEFSPDFISKLVEPIIGQKAIGTFSKDEQLLNKDNPLARCWNLNLGRKFDQMVPDSYPDEAPVYRAILKKDFDRVGGFHTTVGYTDDWSISKKLGVKALAAKGAIFFHRNPETLSEAWLQARWFGKNEFLTGSVTRKLYNLFRYFPILAFLKGLYGVFKFKEEQFLIFKIVYDTAVFTSVLRSFFGEQKNK